MPVLLCRRLAGDGTEAPIPTVERRAAVEDGQVELAQALRVGEDVDLDHLPAPDREARDREGPAIASRDGSRGPVDERRAHEEPEP
jgi:hypothetical protein